MITLKGAKTLQHFTESFTPILHHFNETLEIIQIHASPNSLDEDLELLEYAKTSTLPKKFLIHRPDELLLRPSLKEFFDKYDQEKLIFFGDLIFKEKFWEERKIHSTIAPHPYLSLSRPSKVDGKYIVGAFTAWGEMRKLEHYLNLVEELSSLDKENKLTYMIGGTFDGRPVSSASHKVKISSEAFIPHFNIQLYHLNGRKRFGESSGSLHRGVTVPVIFEANGMERIETIKVIKVEADDELKTIDYKKAAKEILELALNGLEDTLDQNNLHAAQNTARRFLESIIF